MHFLRYFFSTLLRFSKTVTYSSPGHFVPAPNARVQINNKKRRILTTQINYAEAEPSCS